MPRGGAEIRGEEAAHNRVTGGSDKAGFWAGLTHPVLFILLPRGLGSKTVNPGEHANLWSGSCFIALFSPPSEPQNTKARGQQAQALRLCRGSGPRWGLRVSPGCGHTVGRKDAGGGLLVEAAGREAG